MIVTNIHNLKYNENGSDTQKVHCPKCHDERKNKSDKSLSIVLSKRLFKCHHCDFSGRLDGWEDDKKSYTKPSKSGWSKYGEKVQVFLFSRGFSIETIQKNNIIQKTMTDKETGKALTFVGYPYFTLEETDPVNVKWRCVEKKLFTQEKNAKPTLYNLPYWHDSETVIIVEGENDVLAFNEAGFMNCTTVSGGAINENDVNVDGKLASFHNSYKYIENKKLVYIATDNDGPGRRLRDELVRRISPEKCRLIDFGNGCKDANESLQKHGKESLQAAFEEAKEIPISGVFYLSDQMETMLDTFNNGTRMGDPTYFGQVDTIFRWKKGQINLWTGYANLGKSTVFMQMALTKSIMDDWKWAIFSPENYPASDFYDDIIEMYIGKNVVDTYKNKMTLAEYQTACEFINKYFFFIYPDDEHTVDALHEAFQRLMLKHGIDGVLIDPYNQVEKSIRGERTDEEISEFMRKCKRLAVQNNISYNIIAHPRQPIRNSDNNAFKPADAYDIAGGAMWANKSDNILSINRPNWATDKKDPTTDIYSQKVKRKRTGGDLGFVTIKYDMRSARFYEDHATSRVFFCRPERRTEKDRDAGSFKEAFQFDEEAPF